MNDTITRLRAAIDRVIENEARTTVVDGVVYVQANAILRAVDMTPQESAPDALSRLPDPKAWMIGECGPIPQEKKARDRWLTQLGVLVSYHIDAKQSLVQESAPAPVPPDDEREREIRRGYDRLTEEQLALATVPVSVTGELLSIIDATRAEVARLTEYNLRIIAEDVEAHNEAARLRIERGRLLHSEDPETVRRVTRAVREADQQFDKSGGTSRHWVRECFLPCLTEEGLAIAAPAPQARGRTELRHNEDGSLDEVVISRPTNVHVEQMSPGDWWVGIEREGEDRMALDFAARGKVTLTVTEGDEGAVHKRPAPAPQEPT